MEWIVIIIIIIISVSNSMAKNKKAQNKNASGVSGGRQSGARPSSFGKNLSTFLEKLEVLGDDDGAAAPRVSKPVEQPRTPPVQPHPAVQRSGSMRASRPATEHSMRYNARQMSVPSIRHSPAKSNMLEMSMAQGESMEGEAYEEHAEHVRATAAAYDVPQEHHLNLNLSFAREDIISAVIYSEILRRPNSISGRTLWRRQPRPQWG